MSSEFCNVLDMLKDFLVAPHNGAYRPINFSVNALQVNYCHFDLNGRVLVTLPAKG